METTTLAELEAYHSSHILGNTTSQQNSQRAVVQ